MQKENIIENYSSTPYDDVFRTLVNDCPGLVIPVINEIFGKKYKTGEEIMVLNNELFLNRQNGKQLERITDSNFRIEGIRYHIECQSTVDGSILLRIFEYDSQIALQDSTIENNTLYVKFPNTALLYLRHNENTPEKMNITIEVPDNKCSYQVPVMKVQMYSVEDLFKRKLYFLIPFHIFAFEKFFNSYNTDTEKLNELVEHYEKIMDRLEQEVSQKHINEFIRRTIIDMSKKVLDHISIDHEKMREGVRKTMGGQVLEHEAKTILRKGSNDKLAEQITKKLQKGHDITRIADALEETEERITELIKKYNLQ